MSSTEFFHFASKIITTDYDGTPDRLLAFLDSLNLIKANCAGNEANAVAYVKTKLSGKARDLVDNEDTLESIINKLKYGIKGESSQAVISKMLTMKQRNKSANDFASEIEQLSVKLRRAYITEGVPAAVAETYTTDQVVKALSVNVSSERTKIVMEAGSFGSYQDALAKFLTVSSNEPQANSVLFTQTKRRGGYNNNSNFRGRRNFRGHFNSRQDNRNFSFNRNNSNYSNRGNGNRNSNRGFNQQIRGRSERWVRSYNLNQENEIDSPVGPTENV